MTFLDCANTKEMRGGVTFELKCFLHSVLRCLGWCEGRAAETPALSGGRTSVSCVGVQKWSPLPWWLVKRKKLLWGKHISFPV